MSNIEKTIGGHRFAVPPIASAMDSFVLQPRLAPIIAEVAALVWQAIESDAFKELMGPEVTLKDLTVETLLDLDLNLSEHSGELVAAVTRIANKLPPKELRSITKELLYGASMDGQRLFTENGDPFNALLRGKTMLIWQVLFFAVQVNYPDVFFRRGASGGATQPPASPSAESST